MTEAGHEKLNSGVDDRLSLGVAGRVGAIGLGVVGAGVLALTWAVRGQDGTDRFLHAYLISFAMLLSLSLGGMFFVLVNHACRSGASVVVRRIGELVAANMVVLATASVPMLLGAGRVYHRWAGPEAVDPVIVGKSLYLNMPMFAARWAVYFVVWIGLGGMYLRLSRRQDRSSDPKLTLTMQKYSPLGLVLFAVTLTLASFDLLKSLDPHWFSTIFGVYYFAGAVVGFYAMQVLICVGLQSVGVLRQSVSTEHYHDMGKMMFAFVVFWAYVAYSQYMLYWYGNIPEETAWFIHRGASTAAADRGPWTAVVIVLLLGHFVIPFVGLLSRAVKRRPVLLAMWAVWLLVMHWVDLWWMIMPAYSGDRVMIGLPEIGCLVGLSCVYVAGLAMLAGNKPLAPTGDPRLGESLAFENI